MHSDTKTTTKTNDVHETRDLAVRVIHAFQALDVLEWALHSRLNDGDGNHLEAFTRPVIEARDLLTLFYDAFLTGSSEEYEAIVRGDAVVRAMPKAEVEANFRAAMAADGVPGFTAPRRGRRRARAAKGGAR